MKRIFVSAALSLFIVGSFFSIPLLIMYAKGWLFWMPMFLWILGGFTFIIVIESKNFKWYDKWFGN